MGANFSIADSATATSQPGDFDFMPGLWEFTFQQRRNDGTFTQAFSGHWSFEKKRVTPPAVLIEDHWRPDVPNATWDDFTWTWRSWNPARKLFEMHGVDTRRGVWSPGLMWTSGDSRLLIQHYGTDIVRFRYFAITPTSFLWRADMSHDGGKTWINDWWTMKATRIAQ